MNPQEKNPEKEPRLDEEHRFTFDYKKHDDDIRHYSTTRSALTSFLMTVGLTLLAGYFSKEHTENSSFFWKTGFVVFGAAALTCLVFSWRTQRSTLHLKRLWDWATDKSEPYPKWSRREGDIGKICWKMTIDPMNGALLLVIILIVRFFVASEPLNFPQDRGSGECSLRRARCNECHSRASGGSGGSFGETKLDSDVAKSAAETAKAYADSARSAAETAKAYAECSKFVYNNCQTPCNDCAEPCDDSCSKPPSKSKHHHR